MARNLDHPSEHTHLKVIGRSNKPESPLPPLNDESDCIGYTCTKIGWYNETKTLHLTTDSLVPSGARFNPGKEYDITNGNSLLKFSTTFHLRE